MSARGIITYVLVLMAILVTAGGCAKHCYRVTDTATNTVYYTFHVDRECDGSVEFRNSKTVSAWSFGEKVCLKSAQVEQMQRCYCRSDDITEPPCPRPCGKISDEEKAPCTACGN